MYIFQHLCKPLWTLLDSVDHLSTLFGPEKGGMRFTEKAMKNKGELLDVGSLWTLQTFLDLVSLGKHSQYRRQGALSHYAVCRNTPGITL